MSPETYDLAVIGGGLTGTAVARDAAGRGLSVFLAEANDLGEGASSATGGVVCGPLGYFHPLALGRLRAEAAEREVLMRTAPHLARPLRFLMPHHHGLWPGWAIRLGLWALDRAARSSLAGSGRVDLAHEAGRGPLRDHFALAYTVSDCMADDTRLVVLNAIDARTRGATIRPRLRCNVAEREGESWRLSLESRAEGEPFVVSARVLVNAGGAAVAAVNDHVIHTARQLTLRVVKRAYICARLNMPEGDAYVLPQPGGVLIYAVPVAQGLCLIGPRVTPYAGDPATARIDRNDLSSLRDAANQYLQSPLDPEDVVSGMATASVICQGARQWTVDIDAPARQAPLITVIGATLATHRRAAEAAVSATGRFLKVGPVWTAGAALPGGAFPQGGIAEMAKTIRAAYRFIPETQANRFARAYGSRAQDILTGSRVLADLGRRFGADLTEVEVNYLRREEWAETAADILWRRTKLGFHVTAAEAAELAVWLTRNRVSPAGPVMP